MMNKLIVGPTYKHRKTGGLYTISGLCELKINGEWVGGVSYISIENIGKTFVREFSDFTRKFELVREVSK